MPRIAIDANPLVNNHARRGIGRTTRRLLEEFGRRGWSSDEFELSYYLPGDTWVHPPGWSRISLRRLGPSEDICATALTEGADLLHITDYFHPLYDPEHLLGAAHRPYRLIVTVRDIIPYHYPAMKRPGLERLKANLEPLLAHADHVIAISHCTKSDLIGRLGQSGDQISVVHHGVDHEIFHDRYGPEDLRGTMERYGLAGRYILYVSAFDVRKNHELLLNAAHYLRRAQLADCDVVLVGPSAPPRALVDQVGQLRLQRRVKVLLSVPPTDLARLYCGAALFAFPSLYEGFGNPVLEAMACGAPVVALRTSSVPEITGDAAVLVDKNEYETFGLAMHEVLADEAAALRLREEGKARAAQFTWRAAAEGTLDVYRAVLGRTWSRRRPDPTPATGRR